MRLIAFTARCQSATIIEQYTLHDVRCFDLRVRFSERNRLIVAHGIIEYKYTWDMLINDLHWLNAKEDCYVRVIHEVRNKKQYNHYSCYWFKVFCGFAQTNYPNIKFWCGRNLYNWEYDYHFDSPEPTCTEKYSSVCPPKYLDDWFPWFYARLNNEKIFKQGTTDDILLIDFVNIK